MGTNLQKVLRYFLRFGYKPSFQEIYTFFPKKIGRKRLLDYIDRTSRDTLGEYNDKFKVQDYKFKISLNKINRVRKYLDFVSRFPQIRLIGFSGSVAMLNATKTDDVDLFIITAKNRIWTARLIVNLVALLSGLKRKRREKQAQNKVCLNLFFDESSLYIPKKYQTNYMAHEVLQMVPILDVNQSYRSFLLRNGWIRIYCPNVDPKSYFPYHFQPERYTPIKRKNKQRIVGEITETILKWIQTWYMRKPIGDERIDEGQLWFHPRDYGRTVGK